MGLGLGVGLGLGLGLGFAIGVRLRVRVRVRVPLSHPLLQPTSLCLHGGTLIVVVVVAHDGLDAPRVRGRARVRGRVTG